MKKKLLMAGAVLCLGLAVAWYLSRPAPIKTTVNQQDLANIRRALQRWRVSNPPIQLPKSPSEAGKVVGTLIDASRVTIDSAVPYGTGRVAVVYHTGNNTNETVLTRDEHGRWNAPGWTWIRLGQPPFSKTPAK